MAEVAVEQSYCNPRDTNIEAVYSFPLPLGAVLLGLEVEIGGNWMNKIGAIALVLGVAFFACMSARSIFASLSATSKASSSVSSSSCLLPLAL
jgi:hypothetical protein